MPIPVAITNAINNYLTALAGISTYCNISSDGNKYELYVYCLTHDALARNFTLVPQSLNGTIFKFKCSPGPINNTYSYFEINATKGIHELRNGIEIQGHSMYHEMDICILTSITSWVNGNRPASINLMVALECKFYSNASGLKGEARKYLGAMVDLSRIPLVIPSFLRPVGIMNLNQSFFKAFVTNVSSALRNDIQNFISDYFLYPRFGVLPYTSEENDLVNAIQWHSSTW